MKSKETILKLCKKRGETPLECILRFKKDNPEYKNEKMTYAGRLDPLAEGLLLVLVGEECKNKEKYLGLDKEYEVDILLGFSTDSYDLLGKVINRISTDRLGICDADNCFGAIKSFVGKFLQKYPPFSSKTLKGKTLFSLFKKGELKEEEIPEKEVEIKSINMSWARRISKEDLFKYIEKSIMLVSGDFRQREILEIWNKELSSIKMGDFPIISLNVSCTSGTYMRSLANSIGEKIGIPSLALNIKRIQVGDYKI